MQATTYAAPAPLHLVQEKTKIGAHGGRFVTIRALTKAKDGTPRHEVVVAAGRDPVTGKYRQISRTVRGSRREAEKVERSLKTEVDEDRHRGSDATVAVLLDRWLDLVSDGIGAKTHHTWRGYIDNRIVPALGTRKVRKLRVDELDDLYRRLSRDEGLAPATVRQIHAILRQALRQAEVWKWVTVSPARNATLPRARKVELEAAEPAQVRLLIETADASNADFGTFLRLAAATGARRGELCGLRWGDIDFDAGMVRISRAIGVVPGAPPFVKDTKTHQERRLTLDPQTVERLAGHRAKAAERLVGASAPAGLDPYIFSDEADCSLPWNPDNVSSTFRRLRDRLGLPAIHLHSLRHWHASMLADDNTVPIATTSKRVGHSDTGFTQRVYVHAVDARDADAAAVIGRLLSVPETAKGRPA
jgi:integrase